MGPQDLFDTSSSVSRAEYLDALNSWLDQSEKVGRLQSEGSIEVYRAMWMAFATWAVSKGVPLSKIAAVDIQDYLNTRGGRNELSTRYAWRLANLIDRILDQHARQTGLSKSLAAVEFLHQHPAIRFANSSQHAQIPECLEAGDARALVAFLNEARRLTTDINWQEARNRAAVSVMLGAGLTPAEIQHLRLDDVVTDRTNHRPWKLRVVDASKAKPRETPCAKWTGQVLKHWLKVRAELYGPGGWVTL